jgi:hypothetical protein
MDCPKLAELASVITDVFEADLVTVRLLVPEELAKSVSPE